MTERQKEWIAMTVLIIGIVMMGVPFGLYIAQFIGDWWPLLSLVTATVGALSVGIAIWVLRQVYGRYRENVNASHTSTD